MKEEQLFEALSEVGDDLIDMAARKRFVSPWRKWGQAAAIFAVVVCLGALAASFFPTGFEYAKETSAPTLTMDSTEEEYEECVVEETVLCEETPCECVDESAIPDLSVSDSIEEDAAVTLDEVRRAVAEEDHEWLAKTFVQPVEETAVNIIEAVTEDDRLFLLISLPDEKVVTKEYIIRFEEDSWYYETINELEPDGITEP